MYVYLLHKGDSCALGSYLCWKLTFINIRQRCCIMCTVVTFCLLWWAYCQSELVKRPLFDITSKILIWETVFLSLDYLFCLFMYKKCFLGVDMCAFLNKIHYFQCFLHFRKSVAFSKICSANFEFVLLFLNECQYYL